MPDWLWAQLERDPAETESWCLVVRLGRREWYLWWDRSPRVTTWKDTGPTPPIQTSRRVD